MIKLKIIEYIEKYGLDKAILDFNLICKDDGKRILLKYNQISSPMGIDEVQECRGLILEKDTWKILCLSFKKFFNAEEPNAAKIDWDTAHVLEKLDGSLLTLYFYNGIWNTSTTGTALGEGMVNNKTGTTFSDLFWKIMKEKYDLDTLKLNENYCYMFELCSPFNVVVTPHTESSLALLAVRNLKDLSEYNYEALKTVSETLGVPLVKAFDINVKDVGGIKRTFDGMPFTEEGYVVVDGNFNRIKIKNPAYVSAHHLKGKMGRYHIMSIIKSNEIDEFIATFKEREEEIKHLESGYKLLTSKLANCWDELEQLKPKNITLEEKKKFAMNVFAVSDKHDVKGFTGLFFGLNGGKVKSINDFMFNFDDKSLYQLLISGL